MRFMHPALVLNCLRLIRFANLSMPCKEASICAAKNRINYVQTKTIDYFPPLIYNAVIKMLLKKARKHESFCRKQSVE